MPKEISTELSEDRLGVAAQLMLDVLHKALDDAGTLPPTPRAASEIQARRYRRIKPTFESSQRQRRASSRKF
jgi:hypothetical protein